MNIIFYALYVISSSLWGVKNVIKYRYFAKHCMKVKHSSIMTTLGYKIKTENKTSEAKTWRIQ